MKRTLADSGFSSSISQTETIAVAQAMWFCISRQSHACSEDAQSHVRQIGEGMKQQRLRCRNSGPGSYHLFAPTSQENCMLYGSQSFARSAGLFGLLNRLLARGRKPFICSFLLGAYLTAVLRSTALGQEAGSLDLSFAPGAGSVDSVRAVALQPDGKVMRKSSVWPCKAMGKS